MASEDPKDPLNDWKSIGFDANKDSDAAKVVKKRPRRRIREIPECYFLPRMSWPKTIGFYGAAIVGGIGAGFLVEIWIRKKVKEDGGVIWEFDK